MSSLSRSMARQAAREHGRTWRPGVESWGRLETSQYFRKAKARHRRARVLGKVSKRRNRYG